MIGLLSGIVVQVDDNKLIVMTSGGVGYEVIAGGSVLAEVKLNESAEIQIHTIVREQEITLYGFSDASEKAFFTKLLTVSGVGPKIALQVISTPINEFLSAVDRGDDAFITRTPGIGKKMAQKIILELQGKLDLSSEASPKSQAMSEASEALKNLGYDAATVEFTLKNAPDGADSESLIKYFLTSNN